MGLDLRGAYVASSRMNFERLVERAARWDYSISSNELSTRIWKRVYPVPFETLEIGYPRNDALVNATQADIDRIRGELASHPVNAQFSLRRRTASIRRRTSRRSTSSAWPVSSGPTT